MATASYYSLAATSSGSGKLWVRSLGRNSLLISTAHLHSKIQTSPLHIRMLRSLNCRCRRSSRRLQHQCRVEQAHTVLRGTSEGRRIPCSKCHTLHCASTLLPLHRSIVTCTKSHRCLQGIRFHRTRDQTLARNRIFQGLCYKLRRSSR